MIQLSLKLFVKLLLRNVFGFFQLEATEDGVRCVVNQTEAIMNTHSGVITFRSAGLFCCFTVINRETGSQLTNCSQIGTDSHRFTCEVSHLKPGSVYHFAIISQTDRKQFNISLPTGTCV